MKSFGIFLLKCKVAPHQVQPWLARRLLASVGVGEAVQPKGLPQARGELLWGKMPPHLLHTLPGGVEHGQAGVASRP